MSSAPSDVPSPNLEAHQTADTSTDETSDQPIIRLGRDDRQSIALNGLFVIAVLLLLYVASSLLIPIVVALLLSILFSPIVNALSRSGLPEPFGAALIVGAFLAGLVGIIVALSTPTQDWLERVPNNFFRIEQKLEAMKKPISELAEAGETIEEATRLGEKNPLEVTIERPGVTQQFLTGTPQVLASIGMVILLLYFLLASGDTFLRKLIAITPSMKDKKRSVEITRSIQGDIAFYLATLTLMNAVLGVTMALFCWAIGLPDPALWGAMVALLSFAPYAGSAVITGILVFVGLLTFSDWWTALAPAAVYLALMFIVGNVIVPYALGRRLTLSPLAIFIAIIFWGWMWGVIGALVAVPLLASFKIICERVDSLKPVAEFLTP